MFASTSPWVLASTLTGGIGLFLLGVSLLTDGLKLAAGRALERILAAWTRTPLHGLATGVLLTALLQSSTAMTVAAIGFVNAGLLGFGPALWVVFGSNLGSSFTGWLVAWLGFGLKIDAFALPFIGLGMALRLTGAGSLRGAIGTTMTGFGAMFLGIDLLKEGFAGLGPEALPVLGGGLAGTAAAVGLGLALTILLQASSATLTLVLAAVGGGMMPLETGAAVVIGANVGTTLTGILAAVGATSNAKRLAGAHVLFNVVTAAVAVALLHPLLGIVDVFARWLLDTSDGITELVVFHTAFNALGVLLMWPLSRPLSRFLLARFRSAEDDADQARYLDRNVAAVPELAVQALRRETARLGHLALGLAADAVRLAPGSGAWSPAPPQSQLVLSRQLQTVERLQRQIGNFVVTVNRKAMPAGAAAQLPPLLRAVVYYDTLARAMHHVGMEVLHLSREGADAPRSLPWIGRGAAESGQHPGRPAMFAEIASVAASALAAFSSADPEAESVPTLMDEARDRFEGDYQASKARLLQAGASGEYELESVSNWLVLLSELHRAVDQSCKAAEALAQLPSVLPERVGHQTPGADSA
ncbi:Na+/Pi-cotransporter [Pigmentiphaga humi]|uniref:Na+/Pi-cotransporter n=1 Tax=Pigmentiphaga humi TaxID=2478468 RepID=A0A3P4B5U3_9BURK|nr:Na/Pi symporter [Pigmentiphaga humi]VCU71669.1 Na+/Pi-cotransporter [Pigmentiphaga humi]